MGVVIMFRDIGSVGKVRVFGTFPASSEGLVKAIADSAVLPNETYSIEPLLDSAQLLPLGGRVPDQMPGATTVQSARLHRAQLDPVAVSQPVERRDSSDLVDPQAKPGDAYYGSTAKDDYSIVPGCEWGRRDGLGKWWAVYRGLRWVASFPAASDAEEFIRVYLHGVFAYISPKE